MDYIIIINPNDFMYKKLTNCEYIYSDKNIVISKEYCNKKTYHGSLTKGIYLNMKYAIDNYEFSYFIILSSRNMFYNILDNTESIKSLIINNGISYDKLPISKWHWKFHSKTLLGQYIIKNNVLFSSGAHEGLTFDFITSKHIVDFLEKNITIKEDLFTFNHAVEEFSFQSIAINTSGYYYNIGNGVYTHNNPSILPKNKFVHKITR